MNGLRTHNALLAAAKARSGTSGYPLKKNASAGAFLALVGMLIVLLLNEAWPYVITTVIGGLWVVGLMGLAS